MKFESTYNIGDVFWKIENNKPTSFTVKKIKVEQNSDYEVSEEYVTHYRSNLIGVDRTLTVGEIEKYYYPTKEECILSLFKV